MALLRTQIGRKIQDISGNVVTGATATIMSLPAMSTATIYATESGTTTIAQPLITGVDGGITGWLEIGDYSVTVQSSSGTSTARYYASHPRQAYLETSGANDVPMTVKAGSALAVNMAEWKNAAGTTVMSVSTAGSITSPTVTAIQGSVAAVNSSLGSVSGLVTNTQGSVVALSSSLGSVSGTVAAQGTSITSISGSVIALAGTAGTAVNLTATQGSVTNIQGSVVTLSSDTRFNPPGVIMQYVGTAAPSGYLLCDGTSYGTATYPNLFAIIGYTYGGSGENFNLPDLRGRIPVGKGTHSDVDQLGDNDGASLANRRPKHQHTVYDPGHSHTITVYSDTQGYADDKVEAGQYLYPSGNTPSTNPATTGIKVNPEGAVSSSSPQDAPSYLVVNYIIKT